jgi:hypothetical protein
MRIRWGGGGNRYYTTSDVKGLDKTTKFSIMRT